MVTKYNHLNLKDWPFKLVPDEEYCKIWAGRKELKKEIEFFLRSLQRRKMSTIRLMWAWVGSGKSHTLQHIKYLCNNKYESIYPFYIVFPKSAKSFHDVYKQIIEIIDIEGIISSYKGNTSPKYLERFIEIIRHGTEPQKDIALSWIKGERVDLRTLRRIGINYRIEDAETSVRALCEVIRLIIENNPDVMILIMIDEIQRIGQLKSSQKNDINIALHTLFNDLPDNLTMILSYSVRQQDMIFNLISSELKSRANIGNIFELSVFNKQEAKTFINELLNIFKIDIKNKSPFSDSSIDYIISYIESSNEYELKPRDIIERFNDVLERGDLEILDNKLEIIDENLSKIIINR